jgi:transposase InsO family protein
LWAQSLFSAVKIWTPPLTLAAVPSTGVDTVAPFIDTENLPALPDAAQVQEDVQTVVDGASEAVEGWSEAAQPITDALQEAGEDALELLP